MEPDPRTILIVDDSRIAREVLRRRLTAKGYSVTEVESGEAAIAYLRDGPAALVLLDLEMPGLDGVATLARIRGIWSAAELPVLMLSAHLESEDVVGALRAGANDYVSKASDFAVIVARIETQLTLRRLTGRIQEIAVRDELTGLYNRRGFNELAEREEKRHQRHDSGLQAILIDLDRFKEINDLHGHRTGDLVLERVATILTEALRATDLVCRWGGEEFAVVLPQIDLDGAVITAERLRIEIEKLQISTPSGPISVTASAGVASYSDCDSLAQLMQRADRALYEAKRAGRNQVRTYRREEDSGAAGRNR